MAVDVDCGDDCNGEANNDEREFDEAVDKFIQDSHRIFENTIITNEVIKGQSVSRTSENQNFRIYKGYMNENLLSA